VAREQVQPRTPSELLEEYDILAARSAWRPAVPRPRDGEAAICCAFGPVWPPTDSVWTIDCPAMRTPSIWRSLLPEGYSFELDAYPGGMDALSDSVRLGSWHGHHRVPDLPIGVPAPPPDQLRVEVGARFTTVPIIVGPDGIAAWRIEPVTLNRLIAIAKGERP
jgi:hypothetical protein